MIEKKDTLLRTAAKFALDEGKITKGQYDHIISESKRKEEEAIRKEDHNFNLAMKSLSSQRG